MKIADNHKKEDCFDSPEDILKREQLAKDYESNHIGHFVKICKKSGGEVVGILVRIDENKLLVIKGKYGIWRIDPLNIEDFYGRPDKNRPFGGFNGIR